MFKIKTEKLEYLTAEVIKECKQLVHAHSNTNFNSKLLTRKERYKEAIVAFDDYRALRIVIYLRKDDFYQIIISSIYTQQHVDIKSEIISIDTEIDSILSKINDEQQDMLKFSANHQISKKENFIHQNKIKEHRDKINLLVKRRKELNKLIN